jgi:hypothetical protein
MLDSSTIDVTAKQENQYLNNRYQVEEDERRVGMEPIPDSIDLYLNAPQLDALQTMEYFGWQLAFVRRSDLSNIIPVIKHEKKGEFAVLTGEGDIIRSPDIGIRH